MRAISSLATRSPAREQGACTPSELLSPIVLCLLKCNEPLFERHKMPILDGRGRWKSVSLFPQQGTVELKEFGKQRRDAPAIEDGMMKAQGKLKRLRATQMDLKTQQGGLGPVKGATLLLFQPCCQDFFLFCAGELLQIRDLQRNLDVCIDQLQWLAKGVDIKRCAHSRMAVYKTLYGSFQQLVIERHLKMIASDIKIDRNLWMILAMEEHPCLERRERIGIFYIVRQPLPVVKGKQTKGFSLFPARRGMFCCFQYLSKLINGLMLEQLLE